MLFKNILFGIIVFLFIFSSLAQDTKPKVVILGVEHSSQLIKTMHQSAVLRAFIKDVNPSGICIERSPEEYLRGDFYEFTYEHQSVVVPFAKEKRIPLFPVDWLPEEEDIKLAFGTSVLEVPKFTRNPNGFWGFTVFSDTLSFNHSFFFADEPEYPNGIMSWYSEHPTETNRDFPRRLFFI